MSTPRRSKALSPDGQTARFLYTIIKQLDLKSIDWTLVAASLEITNGHAARMRYSRFKQQMEGQTTQSKPAKTTAKKGKPEKEGLEKPTKGKRKTADEQQPAKTKREEQVKREQSRNTSPEPTRPPIKRENESKRIKLEQDTRAPDDITTPIKAEPKPYAMSTLSMAPSTVKPEPDYTYNPDIWRMLPRSNPTPTLAQDPRTIQNQIPNSHSMLAAPPSQPDPMTNSAPYGTVSMLDIQLSPRSFPPAHMIPTSPGSLTPRTLTEGDIDNLNIMDLDGLIKDEPGLFDENGWLITGEAPVGARSET